MEWVTNLFGAISNVASKLKTPAQRKIAKLEYRVEAAMNYVSVVEKSGVYANYDLKKRKKYLLHFRKRIFNV